MGLGWVYFFFNMKVPLWTLWPRAIFQGWFMRKSWGFGFRHVDFNFSPFATLCKGVGLWAFQPALTFRLSKSHALVSTRLTGEAWKSNGEHGRRTLVCFCVCEWNVCHFNCLGLETKKIKSTSKGKKNKTKNEANYWTGSCIYRWELPSSMKNVSAWDMVFSRNNKRRGQCRAAQTKSNSISHRETHSETVASKSQPPQSNGG